MYSRLNTIVELDTDLDEQPLQVEFQVECFIGRDDTPKFDILGFCGNERENKTFVSYAIENSGYKMPANVILNVIPNEHLQYLIDKRNPYVKRFLPEGRIQSALALAILSASRQIKIADDTPVPSSMLRLDGGLHDVSNSTWCLIERICKTEHFTVCDSLRNLIKNCYMPA